MDVEPEFRANPKRRILLKRECDAGLFLRIRTLDARTRAVLRRLGTRGYDHCQQRSRHDDRKPLPIVVQVSGFSRTEALVMRSVRL